ncbi:MAG TPA: ABC transporter permease [Actinomycetes bacterium]|nr:ABC transporter permease [Actinomycetes bacterium]
MIGSLVDWLTDPAHWSGADGIPARLVEHLEYSLLATVLALLIGVPAGLYIGHTGRGTFLVAGLANALRSLPTLGLLILAVLLLLPRLSGDLGFVIPSILVLVILAVPPLLTSTYAGVQSVDPAARDAAYGMGMRDGEVLRKVEVPCALPLMFSGLRSAVLQVIATATVAAYVSLGGLGRFVIDGLASRDYPQVLGGAVLVAALAVVVDLLLALVARLTVSRGLTGRYGRSRTLNAVPSAAVPALPAAPGESS